jgi:hypothetical protein
VAEAEHQVAAEAPADRHRHVDPQLVEQADQGVLVEPQVVAAVGLVGLAAPGQVHHHDAVLRRQHRHHVDEALDARRVPGDHQQGRRVGVGDRAGVEDPQPQTADIHPGCARRLARRSPTGHGAQDRTFRPVRPADPERS